MSSMSAYNITNAIAYGLADFRFGGRSYRTVPAYALGAEKFPKTTEEQVDSYIVPADYKIEAAPRHAAP